MRYPASEKLEIIQLVEQSHLPVKRTLAKLGIPGTTFDRWYDRYQTGGVEALEDRRPKPRRVWNKIPNERRQELLKLAPSASSLAPTEIAEICSWHGFALCLGAQPCIDSYSQPRSSKAARSVPGGAYQPPGR
jgi:transposase-like protein